MINHLRRIAKTRKQDRFEGIISTLKEIGVDYYIEKIDHPSALGNIIVEFNKGNDKKTVICAHYDNINNTPGANDNASGCSILLKLIENFKETKQHLEFVFFDLEELGMVGSRNYLINNTDNINLVFNFDMCGLGENTLYTINNMSNNPFKDIFDKRECIKMDKLPPGDDLTFINNNIPTIDIINSTNKDISWFKQFGKGVMPPYFPDFCKTMHSDYDTIDTLNILQMYKIFLLMIDIINKGEEDGK